MRPPSHASAFLAFVVALALVSAGRADAAIYYRSSSVVETGNGSTSVVLACSVDAGTATKIASAAAGAGLGPWQTTGFGASSLSLSSPTTLRAPLANEVYRVDLLWTLNSGP